jgi:hypothetical protein
VSFTIRDLASPGAKEIPLLADPLPGSNIDSLGVATSLDFSIPAAGLRQPPAGGKWQYNFTVIVADGEKAEWQF